MTRPEYRPRNGKARSFICTHFLAGIALATAMVFSGVDSTWREMSHSLENAEETAVAFALGPFMWIVLFAGMFTAAIANLARPAVHKRLMVLATIAIMPPTVGHAFFSILIGDGPGLRPGLAGPGPLEALAVFALIADFLILAAIVFDWRRLGRPHKAYLIGGTVMVLAQIAVVPLGSSGAWEAIARTISGL